MSGLLLPRELADLRARMLSETGSPRGMARLRTLAALVSDDGALDDVLAFDAAAFERAELLHVEPALVELLFAAREGIGAAGLMDYDLPFPSGMAYLAKKIPAYEQRSSLLSKVADLRAEFNARALELSLEQREEFERLLSIQESEIKDSQLEAISQLNWDEHLLALWSWVPADAEYPHGSVRVSWYLEREAWWGWSDQLALAVTGSEIEMKRRPQLPPFVFDGHVVIGCAPEAAQVRVLRFDGRDVGERDASSDWRARRVDLFRALVYLLRQETVISSRDELPSRPVRRRAAREGRVAPSVRVLSLRGAHRGGGTGEGREYAHRWVVRGHWRRQWYPSIGQHRPRWIMPFVKGPEDAPLLGGEKVYVARK